MPKKRGVSNKPVKQILRIYCEGKKTEPNYLNRYKENYLENRRVKVKVEPTKKITPEQLVDEAIKKKKDKNILKSDPFWVVYDRESRNQYTDEYHQKVLAKAKKNQINIALTNVCFEVWILLHFVDVSASYSNCNDLIKSNLFKKELEKRGISDYEKGNQSIFDVLSDSIDLAKSRAEKMNQTTIKSSYHDESTPYRLNPYTSVHKLLDAIDEFMKKS
ncbi:MAG: hypothetical protein ACI86H_002864 [bacterium]|jgi:hypothetical protein